MWTRCDQWGRLVSVGEEWGHCAALGQAVTGTRFRPVITSTPPFGSCSLRAVRHANGRRCFPRGRRPLRCRASGAPSLQHFQVLHSEGESGTHFPIRGSSSLRARTQGCCQCACCYTTHNAGLAVARLTRFPRRRSTTTHMLPRTRSSWMATPALRPSRPGRTCPRKSWRGSRIGCLLRCEESEICSRSFCLQISATTPEKTGRTPRCHQLLHFMTMPHLRHH